MNDPSISRLIKTGLPILLLLFSISACSIFAPAGTKLYESFFIGEQGTQYFIKPLKLNNNSSEEMNLDVTFRYNENISEEDSAGINFSITSNSLVRDIDSLHFQNDEVFINAAKPQRLFMERERKQYLSRFTTRVPLDQLIKLFHSTRWKIEVYHDNTSRYFSPSNSAKRKIESLDYNLMELIRH